MLWSSTNFLFLNLLIYHVRFIFGKSIKKSKKDINRTNYRTMFGQLLSLAQVKTIRKKKVEKVETKLAQKENLKLEEIASIQKK